MKPAAIAAAMGTALAASAVLAAPAMAEDVTIRNAVAFAGRQHRRRQAKPFLHRDHVAAGKAIFAAPVLTQGDKIG